MSVNDDRVRLQHMRDAAQEVEMFIEGKTRQSLDEDQLLVRGLSMSVSIIGEAAARISDTTQNKYPDVPWAQIKGMRNRLIHAYFAVDLDILWATVTQAIPPLIGQIDAILGDLEED